MAHADSVWRIGMVDGTCENRMAQRCMAHASDLDLNSDLDLILDLDLIWIWI